MKESSDIERRSYEEGLMGTGLEEFAPRCFRSVDRGSHVLLYLEDLSAAYTCPCVMDIKMGTRTFQEKEADNPKLRPDLVQKMLKVEGGAEALTPYELENGVTKLRYMQFREEQSTSATHGWRIEGIVLPDGKYPVPKTLREEAEIHTTLKAYLQGDYERARDCTERLGALRDALEASEWFMSHQVRSSTSTQARKRTITPLSLSADTLHSSSRYTHTQVVSSSLLIIYDGATPPKAPPGVWMIDFAHCIPVDRKAYPSFTHRQPWQIAEGEGDARSRGNKEEGYLFGLDSLHATFESITGELGAGSKV